MPVENRTPSSVSRAGDGQAVEQGVPVLFIAGFGRSGSTLLDRLLGSTPGFHSGGELAGFWRQGLIDDRLCSCGTRFSCCPFWQAVGSRSFSALQADEVDTVIRYLESIFPARMMWRILVRRTRQRVLASTPPQFFDITARVYQELMDESARQVVVDSSKLATYLVLLAEVASLDVHVVHLVRDPRAVAHSWLRPLVTDPDGRSTMPRFGAVKSAVLWLIMNASVEWVSRRLRLPYVRVRYEDLVENPARIVGQIRLEMLAAQDGGTGNARPPAGDIDLGVLHSISGNPMRFQQGRLTVVDDADWRADPWRRRAIVAAITFPLRWRYGYGGRP